MPLSVFTGSLIALGLGAATGSVGAGLIEGLLGPKYVNFYNPDAKKGKIMGAFTMSGGLGFLIAMGIATPLAYYGLSKGGIGVFGYVAQFFFGMSVASIATATLGYGAVRWFKLRNETEST